MPGQGRKHLQLAGIGFADTYPGVGSICNLLELDLQIHIGVNSGRGSICNLLKLELQMPITKLILRILQQLRWDCFFMSKKSKMFL